MAFPASTALGSVYDPVLGNRLLAQAAAATAAVAQQQAQMGRKAEQRAKAEFKSGEYSEYEGISTFLVPLH